MCSNYSHTQASGGIAISLDVRMYTGGRFNGEQTQRIPPRMSQVLDQFLSDWQAMSYYQACVCYSIFSLTTLMNPAVYL